MTRRVCIRCGTLQPANGGQPCTACGASSFSLVPSPRTLEEAIAKAQPWLGAGDDEHDYSPETP